MTERETCKTCRWWEEYSTEVMLEGAPREGSCRIRSVPGFFPPRDEIDWCGEHKPLPSDDEAGFPDRIQTL